MAAANNKITIPSSKVNIALAAGATAAAMKEAGAASGKLFLVPVDKIKLIPGFNVRVDSPDYRAHRDMIADSIATNGFDETKPLAGYVAKEGDDNVIYVTDGHTRLDAVSVVNGTDGATKIDKLPVIVRSTAPSLTDLTVMLHTNNTGRPLSPFELGVVVKRLLKEDGADKKTIAGKLGVTPRYLDDVLLLVNSPKEIRTAVLNGQVSATLAIQELRKAGDTVLKAVERITAAVEKATKSGKAKATAKDTEDAGPKMKKIVETISIGEGTDIKELVKATAAKLRANIPNEADGEGDEAAKLVTVDGTITITIQVPKAADPIVAAAPAKKPAAKKTGTKSSVTKPTATKEGGDPAPAAEATSDKPAPKKHGGTAKAAAPAPAPAPEPEGDDENITADDTDLGIPGAEPVTDEGLDDEVAILPPSTKGNADNNEGDSDI